MLLALLLLASPLEKLVLEAIRFPTYEKNAEAHAAQKAWLAQTAQGFGFMVRDAGTVTEIELPGPAGAPVLGLVVHGDVQPVEASAWSVPPFAGVLRDGVIWGRGAADDKGPLVQALLAMESLKPLQRTHTVRLLVGTDEESGSDDMKAYLKDHAPPDYSLVLDAAFPVVTGEKAWDGLAVVAPDDGPASGFRIGELTAGLAPSIVPDVARLVLLEPPAALPAKLRARKLDRGTRADFREAPGTLEIAVHGRSAHSGMNPDAGRNALVSLAHLVHGLLPACAAADLLDFAAYVGADPHARKLGLPGAPGWGGFIVNAATVARKHPHFEKRDGQLSLIVNFRRPPPLSAAQSRERLFALVTGFSRRLIPDEYYFKDEPFVIDPQGKLVQRLMDDYARATGKREPPSISGGGTYAKRIPNAVAFGMWFPGKPYPGHDVDERVSVKDLERGLRVLKLTLADLACGAPLHDPFKPL